MHSWYRSLLLPMAGITLSFDTPDSSIKRRRSSPPIKAKFQQNETSPLKQWSSPSLIATTLVVADQFIDSSTTYTTSNKPDDSNLHHSKQNEWMTRCISCNNSTQVAPSKESCTEGLSANVLNASASSLSIQQTENVGSLSTQVSSSQLEELVMSESVDQNAPIVILFGWAGCRDRYLSKYSSYYEKQGLAVARFTVPIKKVRSFSSYRKYALEIYEQILEQHPGRPIIFHMFSMNGCSLFTALWDLLETVADGSDIKKRTKGLIFDSSPANVLPWQAANAVSFAMFPPSKSGAFPREIYRVALAGIFGIHRSLVWLQSNFNDKTYEKHFSYFRLQRFEDLPKHQLYLYSDADDICLKDSIESFQQVQKERNANIRTKRWHNSKHCEHLRMHENEYTKLCIDFAKESLK